MAEPLLYQGKMRFPQWSGSLNAVTMQTGTLKLKLPIGLNPVAYTATFEWSLDTTDMALEIINEMTSKAFNGVYTYTDEVGGLCYVRPTGIFGYNEAADGLPCFLSMGFDKL